MYEKTALYSDILSSIHESPRFAYILYALKPLSVGKFWMAFSRVGTDAWQSMHTGLTCWPGVMTESQIVLEEAEEGADIDDRKTGRSRVTNSNPWLCRSLDRFSFLHTVFSLKLDSMPTKL
jgi:hypothetical protein